MSTEYAQIIKQIFTKNSRLRDQRIYNNKVHSLGWSADGSKLGTGSSDRAINIFYLDNFSLTKGSTIRGHSNAVDQLRWHPTDSHIFSTTGADGSVRLWDTRTSNKSIGLMQGKGENINLAWSPDGNTLAVGNKEDLVSWLDIRKGLEAIHVEQFKCEINEFSWNNEGDYFVLTTGLGTLYFYSFPTLKREYTLKAHAVNVICLQFDPTGKYFAVGSADAVVSVWDISETACIGTLSRLEWPLRTVGFSCDGRMIASGSEDHFIDIAEVETGNQIYKLNTNSAAFTLAWHPKEYLLAFSSDDKTNERDRDQGSVKMFGVNQSTDTLLPNAFKFDVVV